MVLGPFAETKGPRLPGRNPATQKSTVIQEFSAKEASYSPRNASQLENLKIHFDKHDMAIGPNHKFRMIRINPVQHNLLYAFRATETDIFTKRIIQMKASNRGKRSSIQHRINSTKRPTTDNFIVCWTDGSP